MALTSSIGLLAMFLVDLADLFYIAQLGDPALTAAMGFAATILFFGNALTLGLMIATSALSARSIGMGDVAYARRYLTNISAIAVVIAIPVVAIFWLLPEEILDLLGAKGRARQAAADYIRIVAPFHLLNSLGKICSGFLRAHGAARRAMNVTICMGVSNAILDPIFIFYFGFGMNGAAIATAMASTLSFAYAITLIWRHFGGYADFSLTHLKYDLRPIFRILTPTIMTNFATPIGGFITYIFITEYSDDVAAGYAVMGRIVPVAFCVLFSLSGAVGPIIGQNFGAGHFDRIRLTLRQAIALALAYTLCVWPILYALTGPIGTIFHLGADGQELINTFTLFAVPLFFFNGILFISNAACNNLERPSWSMLLNLSRNILGILPFIWLGSLYWGFNGIILGASLGGIIFGLLAIAIAFNLVQIQRKQHSARS